MAEGTTRDLIIIDGNWIRACDELKYLGSIIATRAKSNSGTDSRISQGKQAKQKLNSL